MKRTAIGATGLEVTDISFGTSALRDMPTTYGYPVDEERARSTIHAIFDGPANVMDTSRNYGSGRSEERIGAVIKERGGLPEGFVISTKLDRDMTDLRFDADRARRSIEESLTALNLDRVQILHLHDPEHARDLGEITCRGGAIDELFRMKEEGLAAAVGIAMGRVDMMLPILKDWPFDVLINHNRFTLVNRNAEEMFDFAFGKGIAIFNAAPFAGGVLAKGHGRNQPPDIPGGQHRGFGARQGDRRHLRRPWRADGRCRTSVLDSRPAHHLDDCRHLQARTDPTGA